MAQGYIDLLRALYGSTKAWQNSIESYVQQKIRQIDSVSEYEKLHEIQDVAKVKTLVNQLSQQVRILFHRNQDSRRILVLSQLHGVEIS